MELTVLGCWAPYPRAGGACSGYLVREGDVKVLLDAGSGSLSRLMSFIDFRTLDAVVITHLHHDHYLDLFPLRHAVEGARRDGSLEKPLLLYLPQDPGKEFYQLAGYKEAFEAVAIETQPYEMLSGDALAQGMRIGGLAFRFVAAKHSLPGYSVSVQGEDGSKLVYSGDTARTEGLVALANGADFFLCEASGLDKDADYLKDAHLTARQAGEVARDAGVKNLYITHLWPEYQPSVLVALAGEGFGREALAVEEGETYRIVPGSDNNIF